MKTASIKEIKQSLSAKFLHNLNGNVCTITNHGRVCGVLVDLNGRNDLEDFLLANDRKFIDLVRKSAAGGPPIPMTQLERELRERERREIRRKRGRAA